jgi:glycosyltransferase involved in cell wall biosynthesis
VGPAPSSTLTGDRARAELPSLERRLVGDLQRCIPPMTCPETASGSGAQWRERALALVDAPPPAVPAPGGSRPRLAYISPLPPARSGIADYSARLVPHLARFYDLTLIAPEGQGAAISLAADFPLRDPTWLDRHAGEFDRMLYHFGNSGVHRRMCELLRRHPGTVVLHDFFLSHLAAGIAQEDADRNALSRALYESHGYTGLFWQRKLGTDETIWRYPFNKGIVDDAVGVIVHSEFARQLATEWYGPGGADDWRVVPMLRDPGVRRSAPGERERARASLGLAEDDFLVCSFGVLGPVKLNEELLEAFLASRLGGDARCHLVFVGEDDGGDYAAHLCRRAGEISGGRVRVTGYVEPERYSSYLAAADLGVQLRGRTRGESPAALLDCLLGGVPTIANAHGAASDVPRDAVFMLPEVCSLDELASALERLRDDSALRAGLSHRAESYVREHHSPERVAQTYHEALEQLARHSARAGCLGLVREIAQRAGPASPSVPELAEVARAIAAKLPPGSPRHLLVDVSAVAQVDHRTGIQRVVRGVLGSLLAEPPAACRVEPVMSPGLGRPYRHASRFTLDLIGEGALKLPEGTAEFSSGDIFLGLDFFERGTAQNGQVLQSMRERGVRLYFVVYDILPVLRPGDFLPGAERSFEAYLRTIASTADGLICISRTVADEAHRWASSARIARATPLQIGYFHLGVEFEPAPAAGPAGRDGDRLSASLHSRPSFLMVGTVEPRKGHAQALDAFELLWDAGHDVKLVIAGKQGWMVEALADRLRRHPQLGKRLFWAHDASDELLLECYGGAAALLAASEGEGFGLPLIEAAKHGLPVIARELPVFREVAGEHAYYFQGLTPRDLAASLEHWLALHREGQAPDSGGIRWLTWGQSARQLLDLLEHQRWYKQVPASGSERSRT